MPGEGAEFLAVLRIPQSRRLVRAPGQYPFAVGANATELILWSCPTKARSCLPLWASHNGTRSVPVACQHLLAVRRKRPRHQYSRHAP